MIQRIYLVTPPLVLVVGGIQTITRTDLNFDIVNTDLPGTFHTASDSSNTEAKFLLTYQSVLVSIILQS